MYRCIPDVRPAACVWALPGGGGVGWGKYYLGWGRYYLSWGRYYLGWADIASQTTRIDPVGGMLMYTCSADLTAHCIIALRKLSVATTQLFSAIKSKQELILVRM